MASLSTDGTGNRTVQFVGADGKRRSIRLGKLPRKQAEGVRLKVEALVAARRSQLPWDGETAAWVGRLGDDLADRLSRVGLIPERKRATLGSFLGDYMARRDHELKPGTKNTMGHAVADLTAFFGPACRLDDVTPVGADDFKAHQQGRGLASSTVAYRVKMARAFFAYAVKAKLIPENPFAGTSVTAVLPEGRRFYLPVDDARRLIEAADPVFALMIALTRFAGLRCPSEVLSLEWEHIDFGTGRMTVTSPKTEGNEGGAYRVCPLFPAVRPHLDAAWDRAAPGDRYVLPLALRERAFVNGVWSESGQGYNLMRLARRVGLPPWPRAFHNLRASCETDLVARHPMHVVCGWLGHSPAVAAKHYLQITDADFAAALTPAVQNPVQSGAVGGVLEPSSPLALPLKVPERQPPTVPDSSRPVKEPIPAVWPNRSPSPLPPR